MTTPDPLADPGKAILTDADVDRMARAMAFEFGEEFDNADYRVLEFESKDDYRDAVRAVWEARPR